MSLSPGWKTPEIHSPMQTNLVITNADSLKHSGEGTFMSVPGMGIVETHRSSEISFVARIRSGCLILSPRRGGGRSLFVITECLFSKVSSGVAGADQIENRLWKILKVRKTSSKFFA